MEQKRFAHRKPRKDLCRLLTLLLVFAMLPVLPISAGALPAAPKNLFGSELMDKSDYVRSTALVGDTLYILTGMGLYSYAPGEARAKYLSVPGVEAAIQGGEEGVRPASLAAIFSLEGRLLGFDNADQKMYEVSFEDGFLRMTNPVQLDMDDFVEGEGTYTYFTQPTWMQIFDGKLFVKFYNYENKLVDLYSFDLTTGEKTEHKATHLQGMTPYKDGTFLAAFKDPQQYYNPETQERIWPKLVVYNPKDDTVTDHPSGYKFDKAEGELFNLYYDAKEDSLYTNTDTDIYRLDGDFKTTRLIGYLPVLGNFAQVANGITPLSDGRLAITAGNNIYLRERTEAGLTGTTVLTLVGSMENPEILTRIMMEMDDVVVRRMEGLEYNQLSQEQMATLFLTGNIPADLINISAQSFDVDKLIEKGYLTDLSANEKIKGLVSTLPPNLVKYFLKDDKVYVIPSNIMVTPVVVYPARFEAVGLKVPTSLMELLDVVEEWVDGKGEEFPDYSLFGANESMKANLRQFIFDRYISNALGQSDELSFDTPIFRALVERLEGIDYGDYDQDMSGRQMDQSYFQEMFEKKQLIEINIGFDLNHMVTRKRYEREDGISKSVVLSIDGDTPGFIENDINLLMALSTGKNKDIAVEFLGHYVDKMNPVVKAALNPNQTEPIENPFYEQTNEMFEKHIATLEAQLKTAEGADKSNLEMTLEATKAEQNYQREQNQFIATSDDLKYVHSYLTHVFIVTGRANAQRAAYYDNYDLRQQLFEGAISLDQYIKQIDDKLRLVRLEYQ